MIRLWIRSLSLAILLCATALQSEQRPLVVAHRGASAYAPENTLPAFRLAWEQGADAVEGDFHLTRDGRIVCIHDKETKRTADRNLNVSDATLAQLRELDVGAWFNPEFEGTRTPTLNEVLATVPPGKKVYVEIKTGPEIIPTLLRQLDASWLSTEQIIVISFNADVIKEFKFLRPDHKAYWLSGIETDEEGNPKPPADEVLDTLERIAGDGFSSAAKEILNREYVRTLLDAGYEYHAWTIDDPAVARRFIAFGAESITTNMPDTILNAVKR